MKNDMKLIMESWRGSKKLHEINANDPMTYEQFVGILKAMQAAKKGTTADGLAAMLGNLGIFGTTAGESSDAAEVASAIAGMFAESKKTNQQILKEEPITIGTVLLGLKALGMASTAVKTGGFVKRMYKRFRGEPTDETDGLPFLDLLNIDPNYSKILDDWIGELEQKTGPMNTDDMDVNKKMQDWLSSKFSNRSVQGHTAPTPLKTQGDMGDLKKQVRKKRAAGAVKKQL